MRKNTGRTVAGNQLGKALTTLLDDNTRVQGSFSPVKTGASGLTNEDIMRPVTSIMQQLGYIAETANNPSYVSNTDRAVAVSNRLRKLETLIGQLRTNLDERIGIAKGE